MTIHMQSGGTASSLKDVYVDATIETRAVVRQKSILALSHQHGR